MHVIDSHQHFWIYDPINYEWIDNSMSILKKDYLPEELKLIYDNVLVDGCVSVQAASDEKETERLLSYAEKNDFIKGVVGWVDLLAPDVENRLLQFKSNPKFKGVRHVLQAESPDFMEKKEFLHSIDLLTKLDLTYDILIYPKHLFAAHRLVKKFPDQRFVIDHLAKPTIKQQQFENWKDLLQNFKDQSHVHCKISGMITEADWKNWRYKDFIQPLDTVFEVFGTDRLMYGSDWPVCLLAGSYKNVLDILKTYTESFTQIDKEKIFWKNAIQFYKLDASWI